jgi:uncharacterized protein (UPF0210 family)
MFGLPYAEDTQLSTNLLVLQQVLTSLKTMSCVVFGGLDHAPAICKKKLSALWISCVYLWTNL